MTSETTENRKYFSIYIYISELCFVADHQFKEKSEKEDFDILLVKVIIYV